MGFLVGYDDVTWGGEARRRCVEDARLGFGDDESCDDKLRAFGDCQRVREGTGGNPMLVPPTVKSVIEIKDQRAFNRMHIKRPPPLGDYLPTTSVLHRLSAELYSLSFPALSTWGVLRRSMAAGGSDWPAVLSEELLEGLSSSGTESKGALSEATTSTRVVPWLPAVPKRWAVYSYFSKFNAESIGRIRSRYQVPEDVVLRIPNSDEHVCSHVEDVTLYESTLTAGLRFPVQPSIRELLDFLSLAPGQVAPNGWRVIISSMVMWKESSDGLDDITVEEFLYCFEPSQIAASPGFWTFRNKYNLVKLVEGLPSSNCGWKDGYFFIYGDNWERLPEEGIATMKINKSKLKNMVEKGAPAAPINIRRKRIGEGQSRLLSFRFLMRRSPSSKLLTMARPFAGAMDWRRKELRSRLQSSTSKSMPTLGPENISKADGPFSYEVFERGNGDQPTLPFRGGRPSLSEAEVG
uniref:Uncharacterized protein n=1 Tax=Fagus sylvatica TaxID=28930 RepID=A0A2N9EJY2_FAGSY